MGRRQKPPDGSTGAERFALRLREVRASRGFTVRRLADKAGYAASTLSKAESGDQVPSWEVAEAFVQACGEDPATWRSSRLTAAASTARAQEPPALEGTGLTAPQVSPSLQRGRPEAGLPT
ncbi:helix-turn-helix transcriptional regulator [Nonomuraea sp. NPDC005501]|uniref:helix-turn-helix domain-containing protein n=1 Tax=Nonomuraea sp. NPDC005501 TaxID=3156884 RepID=UPI0033A997A6